MTRVMILSAIAGLILSGGIGVCFEPAAGFVAWWPGEGSATEIVGHHDGAPANGVSFPSAVVGQGFRFDGTAGRIFVPDSPALKLTRSFTIECWLCVAGPPGPGNTCGWGMILFRGDDRIGRDPYFLAVRPEGTVVFHIEDAAGGNAELSAAVPMGRYVHIAAILDDATDQMRLFVGNQMAAERVTAVRPFRDLDPSAHPGIGIGNYPNPSYQMPLNGIIDELRVYRRALTLSEIERTAGSVEEGGAPADIPRARTVRIPLPAPSNPAAAVAVPSLAPVRPGPELRLYTAVELVWPTQANTLYRVQWTPSLDDPQWVNLDPVVPGTGREVSLFDSARAHLSGFYRVEIVR